MGIEGITRQADTGSPLVSSGAAFDETSKSPGSSDSGPQPPAPTRISAPPAPDLSQQLEALTRALQERHSNLSFSVDSSTGKIVIQVVRSSTGEVVRQVPSEKALAIAASLDRGEPLDSLGLDRWA